MAASTLAARLKATLGRGAALLVGCEIATRREVRERLAELAAARREADQWRRRAAGLDARIAELESDMAAAHVQTMSLRSRLVCLHGKLATAAATARYQSFALALEARADEV